MAEKQTTAAADRFDSDHIVERLKFRMINHALPLWSREGWDRTTGGFVEQLDWEGRADRLAPRRVRVQGRQIYCFAKAAQLGWYPAGRDIALQGLDYLLAKAKAPDGRSATLTIAKSDMTSTSSTFATRFPCFSLIALERTNREQNLPSIVSTRPSRAWRPWRLRSVAVRRRSSTLKISPGPKIK
jgi:mannose/cellobiose epimerase-like protein (N-acyl-D-glucosamine 2-epimerase family)